VDRFRVVFLECQVEQFAGVPQPGRQLVQADDDVLELRTLLTERLGALRLIPDIGLFEFAPNLGQALRLAIVVKDTSSTHRSVR
jgi:hypothetical protein